MRHVEIDIEMYDVKMQVTGYYERGLDAEVGYSDPSRCAPAEPGEFEVESVHIGGVDVTYLLNLVVLQESTSFGAKVVSPALLRVGRCALEAAEEAGL